MVNADGSGCGYGRMDRDIGIATDVDMEMMIDTIQTKNPTML